MLGLTLCIVHLMSYDKYKISYIHHYSIIHSSFTALKIYLCFCSLSLPPDPLSPWQPGLIISIVFPFPEWQIIRTIVVFEDWLLSLSIMLLRFISVMHVSIIHFFLLLSSIPLCEYTAVFTHSPIGQLQFGVIKNRVTMNIHLQFLCECKFYISGVNTKEWDYWVVR